MAKLTNDSNIAANKLCSMLSLCKRAGQLVSGEASCENAIRLKKANIIFLSREASNNTAKKFLNSSKYYNIPTYILDFTKEQMGGIIGEPQRAVIVITGGDFTAQLTAYAEKFESNGGGPIA